VLTGRRSLAHQGVLMVAITKSRDSLGKPGLRMTIGWRGPIAASAVLISATLAFTQAPPLENWVAASPGEAGLVLIIDAQVSSVDIWSEYGPNETKRFLSFKWSREQPAFAAKFRMKPGDYRFRLQGPISSIGVITETGALTFLRLSPLKGNGGVAAVVTPKAEEDILGLLNEIKRRGGYLSESPLTSPTNTFLVNTEPPWPIPPQPPPKQPIQPQPPPKQ
jgi:hypothetical protein